LLTPPWHQPNVKKHEKYELFDAGIKHKDKNEATDRCWHQSDEK
jgi:hypothetical protein